MIARIRLVFGCVGGAELVGRKLWDVGRAKKLEMKDLRLASGPGLVVNAQRGIASTDGSVWLLGER